MPAGSVGQVVHGASVVGSARRVLAHARHSDFCNIFEVRFGVNFAASGHSRETIASKQDACNYGSHVAIQETHVIWLTSQTMKGRRLQPEAQVLATDQSTHMPLQPE